MSTLIHFLEVLTLILVGVLFVQVSRCYSSFTRMEKVQGDLTRVESDLTKESATMTVRINISSVPKSPSLPEESKVVDDFDLDAPKQDVAKALPTNGQILNDYIGEFFAEPEGQSADIEAFKRSSVEPAKESHEAEQVASQSVVESIATPKSDESPSFAEQDEIIKVESQSKIRPVILAEGISDAEDLPILTEMASVSELSEDDSIITVMPEKGREDSEGNVMSDKVVHAMLDEARLVCAS